MSHPGRLRDKIGAAIRDQALWSPGDRIAVAGSGGMDSVSLLDLLVRTQKWHRGDLSVVTVDHGVREESPMEADHAEGLAHAADLQCTRFALRLGPEASELDCRTARYRCFEQLDVDHVALGHHREDQVETVLLHLMRGTGTAGVRGMNWRRGRYVRPLLAVSRQELSDWASHRQLHWMDDASNQDPRYLRPDDTLFP